MRIDSSDLESALKARVKKPLDLDALTDDQAKRLVGEYIRETLTADRAKLSKDQFHWVGWEKHPRHIWIFFELAVPAVKGQSFDLRVRTLFEVEPALQHVVVLAENLAGQRQLAANTSPKRKRVNHLRQNHSLALRASIKRQQSR